MVVVRLILAYCTCAWIGRGHNIAIPHLVPLYIAGVGGAIGLASGW